MDKPRTTGEVDGAARVRMRGITKRFGNLVANADVDLELHGGTVHALLGENGAGKTTLMNILSGVITPDLGTIEVDGRPVELRSPKAALRLGIGMVHQHFRLIDGLTVSENIHAGWSETPSVFRSRSALEERTRRLGERFGLAVDPKAAVWSLSVGEKQRVEILRTLARGAEVLILDEPTASLVPAETRALFRLIDAVKGDGKAVVFISHKFQEVLAVADQITVMRRGKVVGSVPRSEADAVRLTELVVGGAVSRPHREPAQPGDDVLSLRDGCAADDFGLPGLRHVDLTVREGEIVGIAGVAGNGQRELAEVLTGCRPLSSGTITVGGRDLSGARPHKFIEAGMGAVPEDRLNTGLAKTEPIWRNAILKTYRSAPIAGRGGVMRRAPASEYAQTLCEAVGLGSKSVDDPAGSLSGGQAQRLLLGREMRIGTRALVLAYPTRGLDVRAVETIHSEILAARSKGLAVLLISEDLDELTVLSDRTLVLYEGEIVGEFDEFDRDAIGALMGGMHPSEAAAR